MNGYKVATKGLENERTIILQLEPLEAILVAVDRLTLHPRCSQSLSAVKQREREIPLDYNSISR